MGHDPWLPNVPMAAPFTHCRRNGITTASPHPLAQYLRLEDVLEAVGAVVRGARTEKTLNVFRNPQLAAEARHARRRSGGIDSQRPYPSMDSRFGFLRAPANLGKTPVTNVRNLKSPSWRGWLKVESRCLVPAISFCEWTDTRPKVTHGFALDEARPLFAFAGIWRLWTGERKGETNERSLFAFLTTQSNDVVRLIHADAWLNGPVNDAIALQPRLPNEIVAYRGNG
jgi:hypothetical protein